MPKVIEILVRNECHGQVWYSTQPVGRDPPEELHNPRHQEKGIKSSPWKKDNITTRETK